ncbi:alpha/beta fold hydrolase [Streptomyces sp. SYP-A7185]|uniref:alpha/beta fold hydrolase n=1 Tax=Streptomyces sp. SYP-A7185 TaxID=3040076 RepID=UPI0038F7FD0F
MKKVLAVAAAAIVVAGAATYALPRTAAADGLLTSLTQDTADLTQASAISWGNCPAPPVGVQVDPRQSCGKLKVPLDYRRPHGKQVTIGVSRIPATHQATKRGILMVNPGGPGSEGLNWPSSVAQQTSGPVLASYDLIGFDPRGVGRSDPVTCGLTADELLPPTPYPGPDGSIAGNVAEARSVARRCAAESGDLLPYLTTANTARDMDRIRQSLGQRKISYLGSSYGTYLGAVYATLFPRHADRFVLDSAVDPRRVWHDQFATRSQGVADRFPDFAKYAAEHPGETGFGNTPQAVKAAYLKLAASLDARPIAVPETTTTLNGDLLRYLTTALLGQSDEAFPMLAQTWRAGAGLAAGDASEEEIAWLQQLLPSAGASAGVSPGVPADNTIAAAYAVACDDVSWPRDIKTYARAVAADRKAHPLTAGAPATVWPCAFWPSTPIEPAVKITDRGERNIMILQNERDPNTPLATGKGMHKALGNRSALVTVNAGGHLVYGHHGAAACATDAANLFLISGKLPDRNVHCS